MAKDRARDPKRVPFVNGVRVTPADSHGEGTKWAPNRGEGIVPGGKDGKMIAQSTHDENLETSRHAVENYNKRKRSEGTTPVVRVKS